MRQQQQSRISQQQQHRPRIESDSCEISQESSRLAQRPRQPRISQESSRLAENPRQPRISQESSRLAQQPSPAILRALKSVGVCVEGFRWIPGTYNEPCGKCGQNTGRGYRCAGGSHYVCGRCVNMAMQTHELEKPQAAPQVAAASEAAKELAYQPRTATNNVLRSTSPASFPSSSTATTASSGHDVTELLAKKTLNAVFKGFGYNKSDAFSWSLTSSIDCDVVFPAGQIFVPKNRGRTQNLILRNELKLKLSAGVQKDGRCFAFCGNSNFGCSENGEPMDYVPFTINKGFL